MTCVLHFYRQRYFCSQQRLPTPVNTTHRDYLAEPISSTKNTASTAGTTPCGRLRWPHQVVCTTCTTPVKRRPSFGWRVSAAPSARHLRPASMFPTALVLYTRGTLRLWRPHQHNAAVLVLVVSGSVLESMSFCSHWMPASLFCACCSHACVTPAW